MNIYDKQITDILMDPSFRVLDWSVADIHKVQNWLACQNATLDDLDDSRLQRHWYSVQKIHNFIMEDFPLR